jgi:ATP-dependent Clp endopeptidase proteolytic subunit ClpP
MTDNDLDELMKGKELHPAVVKLLEAKQKLTIAEYETEKARTRLNVAEAEQAEIEAREAADEERSRKAADSFHHVYAFTSQVDATTVKSCIRQLSEWDRNDPTCDMEIIFDSPGGSVISGMHLYDYIQILRAKGHKTTTTTLGMAASMAGILLQAGDVRVMGAESYLLIHEIASVADGKIGEIEDEMVLLHKMQDRVARIFAKRSKLTAAEIKRRWRRKDWWLDSEAALKLELVDEVR